MIRPERESKPPGDDPAGVELVILIGLPASGKSTFCQRQLAETHVVVSKDLMPNNRNPERRQRQLIQAALAEGRSVVVDNTNPSAADRAPLIELGREAGATVIGYYFESTAEKCLERNAQRSGKACVPRVAVYAIRKRLEPPDRQEGFDQLNLVKITDHGEFEISPW